MKKAMILCVVLAGLGTLYVGYLVARARRGLEQFRATYGYQTPTKGLDGCVLESPAWKGILVDSTIAYTDGAHNIQPYDVDGDGRLELVANSYRSDTLMTYREGAGRDPQGRHRWARQIIDSSVGGGLSRPSVRDYAKARIKQVLLGTCTEGAHYTAIADLTGDGRPDLVVAGDLTRHDVVWYEAAPSGPRGATWIKHVAYRDDSHRTYHVETGDIDGDGDADIVFTTKSDRRLGWLQNRRRPGPWPVVIVDANCTRCFYARVMDADQDGRAEIIASQDDCPGSGGKLHLYQHAGHPDTPDDWRRYDIARYPPERGVGVFVTVDLDGDGDLDIAAASHQGDVFVLRNPHPAPVTDLWDSHLVTEGAGKGGSDLREIDVGDIDGDGDLDIVVADEGRNAVVWFENPGPTFRAGWPEHVVDQSDTYLRWCHCTKLGDVDGDGDLDIAVAAAGSNVFLLYLNQATSKEEAHVVASRK